MKSKHYQMLKSKAWRSSLVLFLKEPQKWLRHQWLAMSYSFQLELDDEDFALVLVSLFELVTHVCCVFVGLALFQLSCEVYLHRCQDVFREWQPYDDSPPSVH